MAIIAIFTLFCVGLFLTLWLRAGGSTPLYPQGYRIHVDLPGGVTLAANTDVRVAGVKIGRVASTSLRDKSVAEAVLEIDPRYVPLRADARAMIRHKTLLGESYVAMTLGQATAPPIPDGGTLAAERVAPHVELDQVLRGLDGPTRRRLAALIQEQGANTSGLGEALSTALARLDPFTAQTDRLLATVAAQSPAVSLLVRNGGKLGAVVRGHLGATRRLLFDADLALATVRREGRGLEGTVQQLAPLLAEVPVTTAKLAKLSDRSTGDVEILRQRTSALPDTLSAVAADAPALRQVVAGLDRTAAEARRGVPALTATVPAFGRALTQLAGLGDTAVPTLDFLSHYDRELYGAVANLASSTQGSTRTGTELHHYLRVMPVLNPASLAAYPGAAASVRINPYRVPGTLADFMRGLATSGGSCGTSAPALAPPDGSLLTNDLRERLIAYVFGGIERGPAPIPCRRQDPFPGSTGTYPQVASLSSTPRFVDGR